MTSGSAPLIRADPSRRMVPAIYDPQADPRGPDGGFELAEGATLRDALATWRAEITRAREHCAGRA